MVLLVYAIGVFTLQKRDTSKTVYMKQSHAQPLFISPLVPVVLRCVLVSAKDTFLKHKETWQDHSLTIRGMPDPETIDRQVRLQRAGVAYPLHDATCLVWCFKLGKCDLSQRVLEGASNGYQGR